MAIDIKKLKLTGLVILLSFTILASYAKNLNFYSINSIHGISIRETNSICKDETGFIWASSKTGILRLTEDEHRTYQLPYETADIISVKLAYRDSLLFAYTNNGQIFQYNSYLDRFELLINMSVAVNSRYLSINRLLIDYSGKIWVSSSMGLYSYQNGTLTRINNDDSDVPTIQWYNDHGLFMAKVDGIGIFDIHTLTYKPLFETNYRASRLFYDKFSEKLWIGTLSNGLYYYDLNTHHLSGYMHTDIPKQPILAIEMNSDSTIMIGVDGQGIWELSTQNEQILNVYKENTDNPASLKGNGVYDLFCDDNGRVWVCTYSGGVSFFDQATPLVSQITHMINNSNSLANNDVNSVLEDSNGNLWFATNNGISFWEVSKNRWKSLYHNTQAQAQVFLSLCEDNQGRIWAGTYSSGFYIIDAKTGKEVAHYSQSTNDSFSNNYVFDIFKDSSGDIWVGGVQGDLICYSAKENNFRTYLPYPLYVINELSPGEMLLGCTHGLISLNKQTGQTQNIIQGYIITDIFVTYNYVWLATSGDGLIKYDIDKKTITKFTSDDGLPSNFVNSISFDDRFIWLGTENGLCRFDTENNNVQTYTSFLPLSNVSFNQNANFRLKDGQLIWGTNNGAVYFNPSSIEQIQATGRIFFQDLIITGRSIRNESITPLNETINNLQDITLKYNQNTLTLELLPLGVSTAGSKFSWMLDGYDTDWNIATTNRTVTYTNIPNGEFILKIRMFDPSLSQVISDRELKVQILPPFWKTWWFQSLIMTLIISSVSFTMVYYVSQLKKKHSEEKIRFFANMTHDIRTSLTLIIAPIEELNKETNLTANGRHYLNMASEQIRRLTNVSTQLLDFQKVDIGKEHLSLTMIDIVQLIDHRKMMFDSLAKNKEIKITYSASHDIFLTAVDEMMIEKVIDNLISNAIKYSHPNTTVEINLSCNYTEWTLEVTDKGIGISRKAQRQLFKEFYRGENAINSKIVGSGIGLLLVKEYINLHRGNITFNSRENEGTTFKVSIPYKNVSTQNSANKQSVSGVQISNEEPDSEALQTSVKNDMHILIVEDNDDLRKFMQFPLQEDFQVSVAENGQIAWEFINKEIPDLVVSDVMMPIMDGFELCRLMKSTYETSHIPIILLTALAEKDQQLHGLGLGADDYLTKPFDMGLLAQKIKTIIRNREMIRDKALKLIKSNNDEPVFANELNDKFVKNAIKVVIRNISKSEFGKYDFASEMNVSSSLLYKKIKSLTDQSPSDFIKTIRLNKALELLQTHRYTITEVSEYCGYTSVGYFSTVFRKHFGKSPTEAIDA